MYKSILKYIKEVVYLLGTGKKRIPSLVIMFVILAVLDLIGIGLIGQYVSLIISKDSISSAYIYELLVTVGIIFNKENILLWLGGILIIVFLFKSFVNIFINYKIVQFSFNQQTKLKTFLMNAYQKMPYEEYLRRNSAEYIHSIQTYTSAFGTVLHVGLKTFSDIVIGLSILIMLAIVDIQSLLLFLLLLSMVIIAYDRIFKNNLKLYGKKANEASTAMLQGVHEGVEGLKEIRILGKEKHFYDVVSNGAQEFSSNNIKYLVISSIPRNLLEFVLVLFIVMLVITAITTNTELYTIIPVISMFGIAGLRLMPVVNALANTLSQLRFDRYAISELNKDVSSIPEQNNEENNEANNKSKKVVLFNNLTVDTIEFTYNNMQTCALKEVSFDICNGESIGIIGASGSGKTTLVDTILGLLIPSSGSILYNGNRISLALDEWRSQIAYLPQQVFLIDNTIKNNIALGVNDSDIDNGILNDAINQAQLRELVAQLPDGINSVLGEHGARLSGGQRQRVALARAFYHKREILIMDEATSALDNETENEIINAIKRLKGKKTMIVIAHRLTTLQHCDRIYRLDRGSVVEVGKPNEVLK